MPSPYPMRTFTAAADLEGGAQLAFGGAPWGDACTRHGVAMSRRTATSADRQSRLRAITVTRCTAT